MSRDFSYMKGNKFAVGVGPNRTSFKPGIAPWNKGLKGWCPSGSQKGWFKKGERGNKFVEIGTIKIRRDKQGRDRRWIKVSSLGTPYDWKVYASWLWEKEVGKIPDGLFVHHSDGDTLNDAVSNYSLVTRSTHIAIHRKDLLAAKLQKKLASPSNACARAC